jgi:hypothetical protein
MASRRNSLKHHLLNTVPHLLSPDPLSICITPSAFPYQSLSYPIPDHSSRFALPSFRPLFPSSYSCSSIMLNSNTLTLPSMLPLTKFEAVRLRAPIDNQQGPDHNQHHHERDVQHGTVILALLLVPPAAECHAAIRVAEQFFHGLVLHVPKRHAAVIRAGVAFFFF